MAALPCASARLGQRSGAQHGALSPVPRHTAATGRHRQCAALPSALRCGARGALVLRGVRGEAAASPAATAAEAEAEASQAAPADAAAADTVLYAKAWRRDGRHRDFPESSLPELALRPPTGVAFSGGGSRGYVAALAQLGALRSLGLTPCVKHLTAISGGGWAASVWTFYQRGSCASAPEDDDELLGSSHCFRPESQTAAHLAQMPPRAARGAVCRAALLDEVLRELQGGQSPAAAWRTALHRVIFAPVGIPAGGPWTWNAACAAEAAARNPGTLSASSFLLPAATDRPYLILGVAVLGPVAMVPHRPLRLRGYTLLEVAALAAGVPRTLHVRYTSAVPGTRAKRINRLIGGYIEPWAFGGSLPPKTALPAGQPSGILAVAPQETGLSLAAAAAASSFAPGGLMASQLPGRRLARRLGWSVPYFPPASPHHSASSARVTEMLLADGGCITNPALHPLLQRGAKRCVVFLNFQTPLAARSVWDPAARAPTGADCSEELPALFGCVLDTAAWCFARNAVFPPADLQRVACALQDAAARGRGCVATVEHSTVANAWWGIEAGHKVSVTWCYLSQAPAWVDQLPSETRARLVDPKDAELGPSFPHFGTLDLSLSYVQVNLLHSLASWTVHENAAQFAGALRSEARGAEEGAREGTPGADQTDGWDMPDNLRGRGAGAHPAAGARNRVAAAGRVAARAIAAAILGATSAGPAPAAEDGDGDAQPASGAATPAARAMPVVEATRAERARRAFANAFHRFRGLLPSG